MISLMLGGIGMFIIGMMLTTEGLRAAAGETLRTTLLRFTGGPVLALLTGAAVTALVQSSSVTTVATIGFVGAGLLTFQQSLGLIFGANIGTTVTGWLVATVGLNLSINAFALPIVGAGAALRLFGRGRLVHVGTALAGFGLIFVGVGTLQAGTSSLGDHLTPDLLPDDSLLGRLLLTLIGIVLTSVVQSSSAAMATALTVLHSGGISLTQAAALAIGVNIGTTVTAGIAAIGASTSGKRTAVAHLLFNLLTGVVAFVSLPILVTLAAGLGRHVGSGDPALALAAFHTLFNLLGVALILPFTSLFAKLVSRLVPERGAHLTRHLDVNAKQLGTLAIEAVRQTAVEMAHELFSALADLLARGRISDDTRARIEAVSSAHEETLRFMDQLQGAEHAAPELRRRHASTLHALDHLERLIDVVMRLDDSMFVAHEQIALARERAREVLGHLLEWTGDPRRAAPLETVKALSEHFAATRKSLREEVLDQTARGDLSAQQAGRLIEASRRLDEMTYYLWRITEHLRGERLLLPG